MPTKTTTAKKTRTLKQALADIGKMKQGDFAAKERARVKALGKKTRKPTQLDPLKSIRAQMRKMDTKLNVCMSRAEQIMNSCASIYTEVGKLQSINDKAISEAYERGQKSVIRTPEPWVPKVDGRVANIQAPEVWGYGTVEYLNPASPESAHKTAYVRWDNGRYGTHYFDQLRPVTQTEIDAHLEAEAKKKQEAEWAAITELQEGDACAELSKRQLQELKDILCADGIFPEGGPTVHYERGTALSGSWRKSEHPQWNWLPYPEFLRRAKGTSARLEAEAKPIPFGTRVKVKGADSDGIYWYASGDKHHVVCDFGGLLIVPRNEITVIPTKP